MKCPFCESSIEEAVFAESKNFLAVYNLAPILPGHSLIIPKQHLDSVLRLSNDELSELAAFSRKITILLLKAFHADAFDWSLQENEAAGQTIPHLHMHIVLRFQGDFQDPGDWYPKIRNNCNDVLDSDKRKRLSRNEMKKIVARLRKESGAMGNSP
ncbi:MAG: HIT family protein [Bacteroidales bacterium]|nr:HIT family protein [Bacteroidales bacterium]